MGKFSRQQAGKFLQHRDGMDLQPAKGSFYKLVSKEGKHLFFREVFPPLASTFLFLTKVTQPATLPHEKQKTTARAPPIHRQLNYRSHLKSWERDLAGRRSASGVCMSGLAIRKSDLDVRKSGLAVGPRARNGRAAGVERACRRRGTVVPRARHDGGVLFRNGGKPGANGRLPHAIQ